MKWIGWGGWRLLAKFELFNDRLVAIKVVLLEVIQQFSPTGCHHKQASAGVKILAVCFKMFRKMSDSGGKKGNLHFAGPSVLIVGTILFDYVLFVNLF